MFCDRPDKTSKQLALPLPALDLNLDAVDIRAFLDEVEVDLAVGVAREEQITLPGPPVILVRISALLAVSQKMFCFWCTTVHVVV